MAFIRPYKPSDDDRTAYICRATLPPTLMASQDAIRMAPYLWTHQYTTLCPENCFILDDGTGKAVGYVIGTPDVHAFGAAYPRYVTSVLNGWGKSDVPTPKQLTTREPWLLPADADGNKAVNPECLAQLAYSVDFLVLKGTVTNGEDLKGKMAGEFRATMHIDMVEEFQGQRWGRKMIERFVEGVRGCNGREGVDSGRGIHIGVSGENTKVIKFYERCGFVVREGGESEGNVWMVREL